MIWTPYDWLNKFYNFCMAAIVGINRRCGLRIEECHRYQPNANHRKIKVVQSWNWHTSVQNFACMPYFLGKHLAQVYSHVNIHSFLIFNDVINKELLCSYQLTLLATLHGHKSWYNSGRHHTNDTMGCKWEENKNYYSRLVVVSCEAKKRQHACASSDLRDHCSELFTCMAAQKL